MIRLARSFPQENLGTRDPSQPCTASCRMHLQKRRAPSSALWISAWLLLCARVHGQESCGVEVKILLSPEQTQAVISSFHARHETAGRVLFYDTNKLELLSRGVIVRLRQGADHDITVKLRPRQVLDPSFASAGLKCELDTTGGERQVSYSIRSNYGGERVPETGNEILALLSRPQKRLLGQAQSPIDWNIVRRIADIRTRDWQTRVQPRFNKLTLELWEWPTGRILESSSRVRRGRGHSAYEELRQLVNARGLTLMARQRPKTSIVLETIVPTTFP
jgi:hypothetical protein